MPIPIPLITAGIGALASGIQSAINRKQNKRNIQAQNQGNKALADYQYNKNLEMWNKQNEYNSPTAQMNRFKEAGLNPNLIYSRGSAGNAEGIPQYQAPTYRYDDYPVTDLPQMLTGYNDFRMKQAQWQTEKIEQRGKSIKNTIEDFLRHEKANEYWMKWKAPFGYNPVNIGEQMIQNMLGMSNMNLDKTSNSIQLLKQQQAMNEFMLQFNDVGGKFFNPAIQILRMIFGK